MALSKEQIFAVASEFQTAGQTPTLAAVRKALGGGSFTTISEAMAEWKAAQKASAGQTPKEPTPQAITDKLATLSAEVWVVAQDLASTRIAAERTAMETARSESEAARQEAMALADQVSADLEGAQKALAEAQSARATIEQECARLQGQMAALREHQEARLTDLESERDDAREEAARAREEAAHLRGQVEGLTKALDSQKPKKMDMV